MEPCARVLPFGRASPSAHKCLEVQYRMGDKAKGKGKQLKKPKTSPKDKKATPSK